MEGHVWQSQIYQSSVIRIVSDRTDAIEYRQQNIQLYLMVVLMIIVVMVVSLYFIAKKITKPVQVLQSSFSRVA